MIKHVINALVENQPGVLARAVGLISGRGFNIESLHVDPTSDPTISSLTIVVPGDDRVLVQVTNQLSRLIDVINVSIQDTKIGWKSSNDV
jgi:acetolactate synthase-1/3 small subunit